MKQVGKQIIIFLRSNFRLCQLICFNHTLFLYLGYFYPKSISERRELSDSLQSDGIDAIDKTSSPYEIYLSFAEMEQSNESQKWHHRIWHVLPIKSSWDIFIMTCRETFCYCKDPIFHRKSCWHKVCLVIFRICIVAVNLCAIYVAIVACAASVQISSTKAKLPAVHEKLYKVRAFFATLVH